MNGKLWCKVNTHLWGVTTDKNINKSDKIQMRSGDLFCMFNCLFILLFWFFSTPVLSLFETGAVRPHQTARQCRLRVFNVGFLLPQNVI